MRTDLDDVLLPLAGLDLYRANAFRLTGLPTDATGPQIRRRRDEVAMASRLGAQLPGVGDGPVPAETDVRRVLGAFEVLRDPVTRFVHELLWLWPDDGSDAVAAHNDAVRAHALVLETERHGTALREAWQDALTRWWQVLAYAMPDQVWARAGVLNDPRLSGRVLGLAWDRLRLHLASVNVALAMRAIEDHDDRDAADRYVRLLVESPFDYGLVERATRDAVRPVEHRIRSACTAARDADNTGAGLDTAHRLLTETAGPLDVVDTVLEGDDALDRALRDEVASAVNQCVVAYANAQDEGWLFVRNGPAQALSLLRSAVELASTPTTRARIKENAAGLERMLKATDRLENVVVRDHIPRTDRDAPSTRTSSIAAWVLTALIVALITGVVAAIVAVIGSLAG